MIKARSARSGDFWLAHSRRYADLKQALVPIAEAHATPRLAMPFAHPADWLEDRKAHMAEGVKHLATAARAGAIPGTSIEDGVLKIDRLTAAVPVEADELVLDLYKRLPDVRITDLLLEVECYRLHGSLHPYWRKAMSEGACVSSKRC